MLYRNLPFKYDIIITYKILGSQVIVTRLSSKILIDVLYNENWEFLYLKQTIHEKL